jgi:uracil-DNA glycosylase
MDAIDKYVKELRLSKGEDIPDFSTKGGRTEAKILFLHRDPGKSGASKTGVVDRDNPYTTAKNFREANEKANLDRKLTIAWNAVPWPVDESTFARELETVRSEGWLDKLLESLPKLQVVVLLGEEAQRLTADLYAKRPDLHVLHGPHPSWRGVRTPRRRRWLGNTVCKARDLVDN